MAIGEAVLGRLYLCALALRIGLLVLGEYQDRLSEVKYTDVDYWVYTDASTAVMRGQSPYTRLTYRYTPLLAYLLIPNSVFLPFGKVIFLLSDLLVGKVIEKLTGSNGRWYAAGWLLNPLVINVSTRGSSDTLCALLIVATLYCLKARKTAAAGLCYGLAVHFRIYPIIYAPSFFLSLSKEAAFYRLTKERLLFSLLSAFVFLSLCACFYSLYGWEFLYETYLYHFVRKDNRHNFSVYFYLLYLTFSTTAQQVSFAAFCPQWLLLLLCSFLTSRHNLPLCMLIQTFIFVVFNKVITAQYFLWYMCLLPLVAADMRITVKQAALMVGVWLGTEVHWLYWGYRLEFLGENVFLELWFAGALFFLGNCWIVGKLLAACS